MAIRFTFTDIKVEIAPSLDGLTDVVTRVRYNYKGVNEDGIEGVFAGATPMPLPSDENFVPFNELTEPEVVSWLEAVADKPHMEQQIAKQIQNQIAPKYVPVPNPWDPTTTTTTTTIA